MTTLTAPQRELALRIIHARTVRTKFPEGTLTPQEVDDLIEAADNVLPHYTDDDLYPDLYRPKT